MHDARGPWLVLHKYLVEDVAYRKCDRCGQEAISLKEYERIRLKIAALEKGAKKVHVPGKAAAAAKYFVL